MSGHGRVRQIPEWSRSLGRLSRRVAHRPCEVKIPAYERAPDLEVVPRKPTHSLRVDPQRRFRSSESDNPWTSKAGMRRRHRFPAGEAQSTSQLNENLETELSTPLTTFPRSPLSNIPVQVYFLHGR